MYDASMLASQQIIQTTNATQAAEDWSRVRSPSRARRRLKRGFKQNILHYRKPACYMMQGVLYMHPDFYKELEHQLALRGEKYLAPIPPKVIVETNPEPRQSWIAAHLSFKRPGGLFNNDIVS